MHPYYNCPFWTLISTTILPRQFFCTNSTIISQNNLGMKKPLKAILSKPSFKAGPNRNLDLVADGFVQRSAEYLHGQRFHQVTRKSVWPSDRSPGENKINCLIPRQIFLILPCLQTFHCRPLRRVWLCLFCNHPAGSQRKKPILSYGSMKPFSLVALQAISLTIWRGWHAAGLSPTSQCLSCNREPTTGHRTPCDISQALKR